MFTNVKKFQFQYGKFIIYFVSVRSRWIEQVDLFSDGGNMEILNISANGKVVWRKTADWKNSRVKVREFSLHWLERLPGLRRVFNRSPGYQLKSFHEPWRI